MSKRDTPRGRDRARVIDLDFGQEHVSTVLASPTLCGIEGTLNVRVQHVPQRTGLGLDQVVFGCIFDERHEHG